MMLPVPRAALVCLCLPLLLCGACERAANSETGAGTEAPGDGGTAATTPTGDPSSEPPGADGLLSVHLSAEPGTAGNFPALNAVLVDKASGKLLGAPKVLVPRLATTRLQVEWNFVVAKGPLQLHVYGANGAGCAGAVYTQELSPDRKLLSANLTALLAGQVTGCEVLPADLPPGAALSDPPPAFDLALQVNPSGAATLPDCAAPSYSVSVIRWSDRAVVAQLSDTAALAKGKWPALLAPGLRYLVDVQGTDAGGNAVAAAACHRTWLTDAAWAHTDLGLPDFSQTYRTARTACEVDATGELQIVAPSVVDDAKRSRWSGALNDPSDGAWSLGRLLTHAAGTNDPGLFVQSWLNQLSNATMVNTFIAAGDPALSRAWPQANGRFDLSRAPVQLLAIVNRPDLRVPADNILGELRFVFATEPARGTRGGFLNDFRVILEYNVYGSPTYDIDAWVNDWHALAALSNDPQAYNAALERLTQYVTQSPSKVVVRIRTVNYSSDMPWIFRQFEQDASGMVQSRPVSSTPDASFSTTENPIRGTPAQVAKNKILMDYINANANNILALDYQLPEIYQSARFIAAQSQVPIDYFNVGPPENSQILRRWDAFAANPVDPNALAVFSQNTCNGCHGGEIFPAMLFNRIRAPTPGPLPPSRFSAFLTRDLVRRQADMAAVLCGNQGAHVPGDKVRP